MGAGNMRLTVSGTVQSEVRSEAGLANPGVFASWTVVRNWNRRLYETLTGFCVRISCAELT